MSRRLGLTLAAALAAAPPVWSQGSSPTIPGFTPAAAAAQRRLEEVFLAVPSSASAEQHVRRLAREPHLAGTPGARALADTLAAELRRLGFDVELERFDVWLPHPRRVRLALTRPEILELPTREAPPGRAPDTAAAFVAWNAYAANGTVEAPLVFAGYGLPEDYAALERLGVDPRGKVILARYGRGFRGVKARVAEERGVAGLLLYADPADDGYALGDTLPVGPYRPAWTVQRGTVEYMWVHTGDPLTPGRPAVEGVLRLAPEQATNLPRVPVLPIASATAERLLRLLGGAAAPRAAQGAFPFTYHVGAGPATVRLELEQEFAQRPIWNVIGRLPGRSAQQVIIGNHFDAWVYGGVDPHTGTAAVLEIARGLDALRRSGWTPRREVVLAFWDAEEFGVLGSTEWVERRVRRLREHAVAYFNVDMFTAGTLDVSGSPSLTELVRSAARDVPDPVTGRPLAEDWSARQRSAWSRRWAGVPRARRAPFAPMVGDIGAGSDWTAFLHWAGVPSLQWTMNGRGAYGVYHSLRDDADYTARFADSAFAYTPTLARVMGVAALRLVEADALPFRYSTYARRIGEYLEALERSNLDGEGNPRLGLELNRPRAALARFAAAATRLEEAVANRLAAGDTAGLAAVNVRLPQIEQALLDEAGLPGRPWYRHQIHAPGRETGYEADPLAAPMEAVRQGDQAALNGALQRLTAALERAAAVLAGIGAE